MSFYSDFIYEMEAEQRKDREAQIVKNYRQHLLEMNDDQILALHNIHNHFLSELCGDSSLPYSIVTKAQVLASRLRNRK